MKHLLHTATALGALSLPLQSQITFDSIRYDTDPNNAEINLSVTNNNLGAVFNSGELNIFEQLATELYAKPQNQATYTSLSDMTATWDLNIRGNPTGEVSNGWITSSNSDGTFDLTNIGGRADRDYDTWQNTFSDSTQDEQFYTMNIPLSQLEADGTPGYNPLTDDSISISTTTRPDAFVGFSQSGLTSWQSEGPVYQLNVIPEPSSLIGLLGLGALGFAASLRKRPTLHA